MPGTNYMFYPTNPHGVIDPVIIPIRPLRKMKLSKVRSVAKVTQQVSNK